MRIVRDDRSVGAGLTVRQAEPSDSGALAALWRRVPAAGPAGLVWVEHSDWWAAIGAPEGREVVVAELDGSPVGASAFALFDARLDGRALRLAVVGPWRVEPAGQGRGVFRALQAAVGEAIARVGAEALTLVPVAGPAHRLPRALRRWPDRYERLVLDCAETACDPAIARRARVDDAEGLLTATCAGAVLAPADVGGGLRRRLVRDPRGYGADRLLTNGEAVIGVGRRSATVVTNEGGTRRRQATALDVAATSPTAVRALVGAWSTRLRDEHVDDLVVWTCAGTPIHEALAPLASSVTAHAIDLGLTPPPTAAGRGVHLDAALL